jgi:hypothetical protein
MLEIVLVIVAVAVAFGAGFDIGRMTARNDGEADAR